MKKVLFFISTLHSGGRERRLIELLSYLKEKEKYEILLVMIYDQISYPRLYELGIPWIVLRKNPSSFKIKVFLKFSKVVKDFKPDIIHTWGRGETFYTLPSIIAYRNKLVNSQITTSNQKISFWDRIVDALNFKFSTIVIPNSIAGKETMNCPKSKTEVIYNGINMDRFKNLTDIESIKDKYQLITPFVVVMVATFAQDKDYNLFFQIGNYVTERRKDITFAAVGFHEGNENEFYVNCKKIIGSNSKLKIIGEIREVENFVNACDIGVLLTKREGVPNAVIEYMALGKPVIASDAGGTKEVVSHGKSGYLTKKETVADIGELIIGLIEDPEKRDRLGKKGFEIVQEKFTIERMGKSFEEVYGVVIPSKTESVQSVQYVQ